LARLSETWKPQSGNPFDPDPGAATNIVDYASNNNNIATRNTHIMNSDGFYKWKPIAGNPRTGGGAIAIVTPAQPGNPYNPPVNIGIITDTIAIIIDTLPNGDTQERPQPTLNEHGHINLYLDSLLWERWQESGAEGLNIEIVAPQVIRVTNPLRAALYNIQLNPGEMGWVVAEAEMYEENPPTADFEYGFSLGSVDIETGLTIGSPTHYQLNVLANPTVEQEIEWDHFTGLSNTKNSLATLKMYPTPAKHKLNIDFIAENTNTTMVTIYDLQGKQVKQDTFKSAAKGMNHLEVNVANLPSGNYVVRVQNGENGISKKIIIE
jgi:hypothetical protein